MAEKNGFDITKLIFQNMCACVWHCGAVVKEVLAPSDELGSTLGDAIFCFFASFSFFFFCLVFVFWSYFPFGLFFFIRTSDPADHALGSIYILSFSPELYFRKGTKLVQHKLF